MRLNESAVTSVVGEMLLLVLVIILVSIMAASALSMLTGERETRTDIAMSMNGTHIFFWHHGGD
ncbi:MAG: type IV pilin, partial [Methanomicrobium sp.]|nr:type IV pilin [Methanomicrobium sp.]